MNVLFYTVFKVAVAIGVLLIRFTKNHQQS